MEKLKYKDIWRKLLNNSTVIIRCTTRVESTELTRKLRECGYEPTEESGLDCIKWYRYKSNTCYLIRSDYRVTIIDFEDVKEEKVYEYQLEETCNSTYKAINDLVGEIVGEITNYKLSFEQIVDILDHIPDIAIHCDTKEKAQDFLKKLYNLDFSSTSVVPESLSHWEQHAQDTCYLIKEGSIVFRINIRDAEGIPIFGYMKNVLEDEENNSIPLWQVIKELTEDPNKIFRKIDDGSEMSINKMGKLEWNGGPINPKHLWLEYRTENTNLVGALEALESGKVVLCEVLPGIKYRFKPNDTMKASDIFGAVITVDEMLRADWYIEELK